MNARIESEPGPVKNRTTVERKSDREVVVTRTINGPARIVFEAFTKAELLKRWWVPKSMGMTLLSCEVDARVGGKYRLVFDHGGPEPAAFFGTYVEVQPYSPWVRARDSNRDVDLAVGRPIVPAHTGRGYRVPRYVVSSVPT